MNNNKLEKLVEIFLEKNKHINLSSIKTYEGVWTKHILDSIEFLKIFDISGGKKILDLGTGGGFPLIPLAIENTDSQFIGLDSKKKKINAINEIIQKLGINNVKGIWSRGQEHKNKYDILTSRAFAYVDKLFNCGYHLVKNNGYFVLYKQENDLEKEILKKICKQKSLKLEIEYKYQLFDGDINRIIYIIKKQSIGSS
ncbi:16S rRNA (guanine(527)-N(7))-methyltransferase RsmG [Candidatus Vampirococcus lugosii]|uniref:Ribosomal RNA small subunit methyltransferase G n=1 Tax=Candidatus Vampirococcus lugosii TaxID=2789015 RepID=A0ABS5QML1_9BACT|nr:16S rRNA (guanine(527)-N(7))-methyltransferase RsmG [Candidatus Vampirococcus lugosii]MBS8122441.1 ribosomal RNA small subunit methyltransferase G [Candidatus Vampirococcus lugosii]